jgi:hypothetical protein
MASRVVAVITDRIGGHEVIEQLKVTAGWRLPPTRL